MSEGAIVVFDLDGTLANCEHRKHLIDKELRVPDWRAFFAACVDDTPIEPVCAVYQGLRLARAAQELELFRLGIKTRATPEFWIVSGRSDEVRTVTIEWLYRHSIDYENLLMRREGDTRPDWVVKHEMMAPYLHRVRLVFDDRDSTVQMWRQAGVTCFQVADGNF